ncbi:MAG: trypsin-like peptidase domain-containing protein, partial [Planctomycetales bacterium]|nr:trypsin-like peptidase domain-containing protein [Planctomycetales bacterium]
MSRLFAMREYPPDILPLYAQGYSVATFLIHQCDSITEGRRHFIAFLEDGLADEQWVAAVETHYGTDIAGLQEAWLVWLKNWEQSTQAAKVSTGKPASSGDVSGYATPAEASVVVRTADGSKGSGTAIWPRFVITNCHVVRDAPNQPMVVSQPQLGLSANGHCVYHNESHDLAIIQIDRDFPWAPVAAEVREGEPVTLYGYPGLSTQSVVQRTPYSEHTRRGTQLLQSNGRPWAIFAVSGTSGTSGGGVFNDAGELVAVRWGDDTGTAASDGTHGATLREIHAVIKYVDETQGSCGIGVCVAPRVRGVVEVPRRILRGQQQAGAAAAPQSVASSPP